MNAYGQGVYERDDSIADTNYTAVDDDAWSVGGSSSVSQQSFRVQPRLRYPLVPSVTLLTSFPSIHPSIQGAAQAGATQRR